MPTFRRARIVVTRASAGWRELVALARLQPRVTLRGSRVRDRDDALAVTSRITRFERGRLANPVDAPVTGERVLELASFPTATIEQILSGRLAEPAAFEQAHDEWVVLLTGAAKMLVDGEELELAAGDWLLLPAGCPHTVRDTQPGSSWLAVHLTGRQ